MIRDGTIEWNVARPDDHESGVRRRAHLRVVAYRLAVKRCFGSALDSWDAHTSNLSPPASKAGPAPKLEQQS